MDVECLHRGQGIGTVCCNCSGTVSLAHGNRIWYSQSAAVANKLNISVNLQDYSRSWRKVGWLIGFFFAPHRDAVLLPFNDVALALDGAREALKILFLLCKYIDV